MSSDDIENFLETNDWFIDLIASFHAVSAIFQPCNGGTNENKNTAHKKNQNMILTLFQITCSHFFRLPENKGRVKGSPNYAPFELSIKIAPFLLWEKRWHWVWSYPTAQFHLKYWNNMDTATQSWQICISSSKHSEKWNRSICNPLEKEMSLLQKKNCRKIIFTIL